MNAKTQDRRALFLLVSLLIFLVVSALVTQDRAGLIVLLFALYAILVCALLELYERKGRRWPAISLAGCSMLVSVVCVVHPVRPLLIAGWLLLAILFGIVSVGLFSYLGRPGSVTSARLYASVSLYLILATFYYAVFNLLETVHPGSFMEAGLPASAEIPRHALLYLSLTTLTTLGYGDVLPVTPLARILAVLEAATGVLYIAITVARLVADYQKTGSSQT